MEMITPFQIKRIHTLKSLINKDEYEYRELLRTSFLAKSSKELTSAEANIIIEVLENEAVELNVWKKQPRKYSNLNRDEEMASPAQLRMIEGIWNDITKLEPTKYTQRKLRGHLIKNYKISDVMFLSKKRANDVINGLKKMRNNVKKSAAALA